MLYCNWVSEYKKLNFNCTKYWNGHFDIKKTENCHYFTFNVLCKKLTISRNECTWNFLTNTFKMGFMLFHRTIYEPARMFVDWAFGKLYNAQRRKMPTLAVTGKSVFLSTTNMLPTLRMLWPFNCCNQSIHKWIMNSIKVRGITCLIIKKRFLYCALA